MEINVLDYLDNDEIKEICAEEIRNQVRCRFNEKDLARIISNSAYYKVFGIVDDMLPNGYEEKIVKHVDDIIENSMDFSLFRWKYDSSEPESLGAKIVNEAIENNKDKIKGKINDMIDERLNNNGAVYDMFIDKIIDGMYNGFNIKFDR